MTKSYDLPDPRFDLVLERTVDIAPALVWDAWTKREHLMKWFVPLPWTMSDIEVDLRPGGIFKFVMRSPEGQENTHLCCYLEIVEGRKIVWTNTMAPGYRPVDVGFIPFTAVITMEPAGSGTKYTARAIHKDESGAKTHAEMGFQEGWGTCFDQLVELVKTGAVKKKS